jgi:hypothetical protein
MSKREARGREAVIDPTRPAYYRNSVPTLTFKVTPEEAARIRRQARREGRTVSEMLRARAAQPSAPAKGDASAGYRIEKSPVTGLPVMVAPPGSPEVTSEQVRALLTDFP